MLRKMGSDHLDRDRQVSSCSACERNDLYGVVLVNIQFMHGPDGSLCAGSLTLSMFRSCWNVLYRSITYLVCHSCTSKHLYLIIGLGTSFSKRRNGYLSFVRLEAHSRARTYLFKRGGYRSNVLKGGLENNEGAGLSGNQTQFSRSQTSISYPDQVTCVVLTAAFQSRSMTNPLRSSRNSRNLFFDLVSLSNPCGLLSEIHDSSP